MRPIKNKQIRMRKLLYLLIAAMMAAVAWGQDVDTEQARKDSLRTIDADTVNSLPNIGIIGDVITGYRLTGVPVNTDEFIHIDTIMVTNRHRNAVRLYHIDSEGNRVRKIVVLRDRWAGLPDDLSMWSETNLKGETCTGEAGYKLAALTKKEYEIAKRLDDIWGEIFEASYPAGYEYWSGDRDTIRNRPGYEIVCYSDSLRLEEIPDMGTKQRRYTRELMTYTGSDGKSYCLAAPNWHTRQADYTEEASDGKYHCRWMFCSPRESDYWMRKYKKYYGLEKPYISM